MKVRELFTQWGFKIDDKPLNDLEDNLSDVMDMVTQVGTAATAAAAAFFGLATATSMLGQNLAKISSQTGIDSKKLEEFRFAAEQMGIEASTMDGALINLAQTIAESKYGFGSGREGLELMAREAHVILDLTGDIDNQFNNIVDGLSRITNVNTRGIVAEKFFGGSARDMMILFDQGSEGIAKMRKEFNRLQGGMSKEGIEASKKFTAAMGKFMTILKGIGATIGEYVMPAFSGLIDSIGEFVLINRDLITSSINDFWDTFSEFLKDAFEFGKDLLGVIKAIIKPFGGVVKLMKIFVVLYASVMAFKAMMSIGNIILFFGSIITGLTGVNAGLVMTNILMGGLPLLLGAIVIGLALIAEDLYVFSKGGDSVFGDLMKFIDKVGNKIEYWINKIKNKVIKRETKKMKKALLDSILSVLPGGMAIKVGTLALNELRKGAIGAENIKSSLPPLSNRQGSGGAQSIVNGKFDINVNSNLPPEQAAKAVEKGVKDIIGDIISDANRDSTPTAVY